VKILLTGKTGQIGYELERSLQGLGEIVAVDRSQMDLADLDQVRDVVRAIRPALIVNPAAYTAVDKAETEPGLAMRVNAEAPKVMAEEAKKLGAAIIHYSTDYVFDGAKNSPYTEEDAARPINVYGSTKLLGEQAIQAAEIPHLILRTSWVYGMRGRNFLRTVLQLAQERNELRIVSDQHGTPTWCRTVADITAHIVARSREAQHPAAWWDQYSGIYHVTAAGQTTWHGFANAIVQNASLANIPLVTPIATKDYPVIAKRPPYSVMSLERLRRAFCEPPEWEGALRLCQKS
jgi:dTDP-4-dehydrorhamnose reductase